MAGAGRSGPACGVWVEQIYPSVASTQTGGPPVSVRSPGAHLMLPWFTRVQLSVRSALSATMVT